MDILESWSTHYGLRKQVRKRYPCIWKVPLAKNRLELVLREVASGSRVLDVGASNRMLGDRIRAVYPDITYRSMDVDRDADHDYYGLDEIGEEFDLIVLSEVIEHMTVEEGAVTLGKLGGLLKEGGKVLITTPNLFHPHRYWDASHRTPYRYDELSALLMSLGYSIDGIYRLYNDAFLKRIFRIHIGVFIHRYLDIDFARSIAVIAARE